MPTPYTASTAPIVNAALLGMSEWVRCATHYSGGALWNNGTWQRRDIRGKPGMISNHAKGIAVDLSYRYMQASRRGTTDGRLKSVQFVKTCLRNYEQLGLMLCIDYMPQPFGRSWRCDRAIDGKPASAWRKALRPTFSGAPGGDWWHIEITPDMANSPAKVAAAFAAVFEVSTTAA